MLGAGDLRSSWIRKNYILKFRDDNDKNIREAVQDKKIILLCDESTDRTGKAVFITLFKLLPSNSKRTCQLFTTGATVLTISEVTGEQTSKTIIQVIDINLIFLSLSIQFCSTNYDM